MPRCYVCFVRQISFSLPPPKIVSPVPIDTRKHRKPSARLRTYGPSVVLWAFEWSRRAQRATRRNSEEVCVFDHVCVFRVCTCGWVCVRCLRPLMDRHDTVVVMAVVVWWVDRKTDMTRVVYDGMNPIQGRAWLRVFSSHPLCLFLFLFPPKPKTLCAVIFSQWPLVKRKDTKTHF